MTTDTREDPALRARIERAAEGLTYTSESDRPFEYVFLPGASERPPGARGFAALVAAPDAPAEEQSLDQFFARHLEDADPHDGEARRLRPRYEALREVLRAELRGAAVYRVGRVEVGCWAVGGDGRGNLVGVRTVAIET